MCGQRGSHGLVKADHDYGENGDADEKLDEAKAGIIEVAQPTEKPTVSLVRSEF
jgi:hypothetical protein